MPPKPSSPGLLFWRRVAALSLEEFGNNEQGKNGGKLGITLVLLSFLGERKNAFQNAFLTQLSPTISF